MNLVKLILLIIPVILLAQNPVDKFEYLEKNADWLVPSEIGIIMEIRRDSILYEEDWMRIVPNRTVITDKSGREIGIGNLQVPCKVEICFFGKGRDKFVKSIRLIKQLQYTSDKYIIGAEMITE